MITLLCGMDAGAYLSLFLVVLDRLGRGVEESLRYLFRS